jgi:hypothetical protein
MLKKKGNWLGVLMAFVLAFVLAFAFVPANRMDVLGAEEGASSFAAPEGYAPASDGVVNLFRGFRALVEDPKPAILLIEDVNPWGAIGHHALLQSLGTVEKVHSSNVGQLDLGRFDLIVFSNDQPDATYVNYAGFKQALEQYVMFGGTLVMGASDRGWNGGTLNGGLPGGLQKISQYEDRNFVVDSFHPIVTGERANGIALTDADLYGNYCSHTSFEEGSLPQNARAILRDAYGSPTLVEYGYGAGTVIASGLTWEHNLAYGGSFAPKALMGLFAYAMHIASDVFFISISSAIVGYDDFVEITVGTKNTPGQAGFSFEFKFDNTGGHLTPVSITRPPTALFSGDIVSNVGQGVDWAQTDTITAVWASHEDATKDSDLFTVRFAVSDNIEYRPYPLNLSGMVVNAAYEELEYVVRPGSITALSFADMAVMYGDARMDRYVDVKDAVRFLQYFLDYAELSRYERVAANVHWDSLDEEGKPGLKPDTINMKDGIKLMRYLAWPEGIVLGSMD